jgi:hypothetical protein
MKVLTVNGFRPQLVRDDPGEVAPVGRRRPVAVGDLGDQIPLGVRPVAVPAGFTRLDVLRQIDPAPVERAGLRVVQLDDPDAVVDVERPGEPVEVALDRRAVQVDVPEQHQRQEHDGVVGVGVFAAEAVEVRPQQRGRVGEQTGGHAGRW